MSDFGSEMNNAELSIMMKLLNTLLSLTSRIFELLKERTSADYRLKKAKLKGVKGEQKRQQFVDDIEGKVGYVRHKDLVKAGVPLTQTEITLNDEQFKLLTARCKREGIVITGVEDVRDRELNGKKAMNVVCKQSDLERLASLIDLINAEKKIEAIRGEINKAKDRIDEAKNKIGVLQDKRKPSAEDKERISELQREIDENQAVVDNLKKQIDDVRCGHSQKMNQEQADGVVENAVNGETQHGISFDEAVDRWTGGSIDKDTTCYIVDAKDPNKYISCTSKNDVFRDKEYIRTTYEVYNGDKQMYATNDRRFEGRPKDYWFNEKKAMKEKGAIGDLVLKFYSREALEAYRANYKEQNASELDNLDLGKEGRDYGGIIKDLESKIEECGGIYKEGTVVDRTTDKPFVFTDDMSDVQRSMAAEACVAGKQIDNYKDIARLENEIAIARTEVLTKVEGTPEHAAAQVEFDKIQSSYTSALRTEEALFEERKGVNAIQAEYDTRSVDQRTEDKENTETHESRSSDVRDGGAKINDSPNVEAHSKEKGTMEEYKAAIADRKGKSVDAKAADRLAPEREGTSPSGGHGSRNPGSDRGDLH